MGKSSHGVFEVEQWSDKRTLSISVDQSPLGACMSQKGPKVGQGMLDFVEDFV